MNIPLGVIQQSTGGSEVLVASYITGDDTDMGFSTYDVQGNTFACSVNRTISKCSFKMYNNGGSASGNIYAKLYAHTGTYGTDGKPTGAVLATSDAVDVATFSSSSAGFEEFTFTTGYAMTAGTKYCIVVAPDSPNLYIRLRMDASSPTYGGNWCYKSNINWYADNSRDAMFTIYGT